MKTPGTIIDIGIAGLTAAATLIRLGHHVTIYERSRFADEVGAAVNIGPNAAPVLDALDFDKQRARLLEVVEGKQFDGATRQETYRGRYDDFASKYRAPWYFSHQVDLHNELKRLALEPPATDAEPAELHLSSAVASVDCEAGVLTLQDGTEVTKDVIVGADGLHVSTIHDGVLIYQIHMTLTSVPALVRRSSMRTRTQHPRRRRQRVRIPLPHPHCQAGRKAGHRAAFPGGGRDASRRGRV